MKGRLPGQISVTGATIGIVIAGFFLLTIMLSGCSGGGQAQEQGTPTSTQIPTSTPFGLDGAALATATATRTATKTPTRFPTMTSTATITPTLTPTVTPRAIATSTKTPTAGPPTATATSAIPPTPVPTATTAIPYSSQGIDWLPNCGMIQILIMVRDASGNPLDGVVARYETVDGGIGSRSNPTGSKGPGLTDFTVNPIGMKAATWRVWLVDAADKPLSLKVDFTSNTADCTGGGHQVGTVNFKKN